ncbi:S8 family serine peptidase [Streptomyces sp. NPDC004284]|uniref:S8 family serine peptidase n=1 Tax=Streptomyces sp. NPDC004284 TaxID=3364695 RepID=UPI0036AB7CCC
MAVLDTWVDAPHPDLAGRIAATAGFVPGESVADANDHGTHVASTVAGTGASSGGQKKGVVPGAAAHRQGALRGRCGMSLGGPTTDGSDPLNLAVDRLSRRRARCSPWPRATPALTAAPWVPQG